LQVSKSDNITKLCHKCADVFRITSDIKRRCLVNQGKTAYGRRNIHVLPFSFPL